VNLQNAEINERGKELENRRRLKQTAKYAAKTSLQLYVIAIRLRVEIHEQKTENMFHQLKKKGKKKQFTSLQGFFFMHLHLIIHTFPQYGNILKNLPWG
jgi:hypothetical protein